MFKILCIVTIVICASLPLYAQTDAQFSIETEEGVFTVSQTSGGYEFIQFSRLLWDEMMQGTKYMFENLKTDQNKVLYIIICTCKDGGCISGIGFRCGIYPEKKINKQARFIVDKLNRVSAIRLKVHDSNTVRMTFLDMINWQSLQDCKK